MKQHLAKMMGQPKQGVWFKKMKSFVLITTTCFLLDLLGVISKCSKVFQKDASSNCVTIKAIKENPGEHLEELLSHMDTSDCEHKGTKDFNLAQKIVSMESRTISLTTALQK